MWNSSSDSERLKKKHTIRKKKNVEFVEQFDTSEDLRKHKKNCK